MKKTEYRSILKHLGLSIKGAGKPLGFGHRQAQRYASGDTPIPGPLSHLLRQMVKHDIKPDDLEQPP